MKEKFNKLIGKIDANKLLIFTLGLIVLQPIFDLDYLMYSVLDQFGIPRVSTIIKFVIMPISVILVFLKLERKKRRVMTVGIIYGTILSIYFAFHCLNSVAIFDTLMLTNNFYFSIFSELTYFLTLIIPLIYIYVVYRLDLNENMLKYSVIIMSFITSVPIVISNVFVFSVSTYSGYTKANFFSWFSNGYDLYNSRELASKFYFTEGNTIGILLFILLPVMLYFVFMAKTKKEKIGLYTLIGFHTLAMVILSTRVATYGVIITPIIVAVAYLFLVIIKREKLKIAFLVILVATSCFYIWMLPFTPAYMNQQIDSENDEFVRGDNAILEDHREGLKDGEGLIPGSYEYNHFYIYYFEDNAFLISSTPKQYYMEWYNYNFDPKFWVDYIFNYSLDERINGRQFQKIFTDYKWASVDVKTKFLGMGYSTFMNGSILLERDFAQQIYTFGYLGFSLLMLPWIVIVLGIGLYVIYRWKTMFTFKVFMLMMALVGGLGNSYISGHTMDQFITSCCLALFTGYMFKLCRDDYYGRK